MSQNVVSKKPQGSHNVSPTFMMKDAAKAIDFYKDVFGAKEKYRLKGPEGSVGHCELEIGDSSIMLGESCPEKSMPDTQNNTFVYVDDVDAAYKKAISKGATSISEPSDMFWGDRMANFKDPFGQTWSIGTHVEDLDQDEIQRRADEAFKKQSPKKNAA